MKLVLILMMLVISLSSWAKNVKQFNEVLIQEVQKDLYNDNDQQFKKNTAPMRAPASVEPEREHQAPENKIHLKDKQLGTNKW